MLFSPVLSSVYCLYPDSKYALPGPSITSTTPISGYNSLYTRLLLFPQEDRRLVRLRFLDFLIALLGFFSSRGLSLGRIREAFLSYYGHFTLSSLGRKFVSA